MSESSQLPLFHVVGFSGHRKLADVAGVERALRAVLLKLREEPGVEWLALSSLAAGSDMLFARTALKVGMGWEAVLPLAPAEFRRDFNETDWREVESLLAYAEHVGVVSDRPQRDDSYLDCGMETVNHCDLLIAVWDGSSPTSARLSMTCRRVPMPSWSVAKQSLPVLRTKMTRPVIPTKSPVATSASSSG